MEDIALTPHGDVELNEDLWRTEPTAQHKRDLLLAGQGDFREFPDMGVDCVDYLLDDDPGELLRAVRKQCQQDGMRVSDVYYAENGTLIIDAEYGNDNR